MSEVCHLSVRWSGTLSKLVFFGHFVFPRARVGLVKKSDEKHRKKSTWHNACNVCVPLEEGVQLKRTSFV